jgi:hypothetical protein
VLCLVAALLTPPSVQAPAFAQAIPQSDLAGRERERFVDPQAPRALPAGPRIALPSTTAPPEAKSIHIRIRGIRIVGSTVYDENDLAPRRNKSLSQLRRRRKL